MEKADIEAVWVTEENIVFDADIVIITVWLDYREIEEKISTKIGSPIISLQEIVEEMKFERERYQV